MFNKLLIANRVAAQPLAVARVQPASRVARGDFAAG